MVLLLGNDLYYSKLELDCKEDGPVWQSFANDSDHTSSLQRGRSNMTILQNDPDLWAPYTVEDPIWQFLAERTVWYYNYSANDPNRPNLCATCKVKFSTQMWIALINSRLKWFSCPLWAPKLDSYSLATILKAKIWSERSYHSTFLTTFIHVPHFPRLDCRQW